MCTFSNNSIGFQYFCMGFSLGVRKSPRASKYAFGFLASLAFLARRAKKANRCFSNRDLRIVRFVCLVDCTCVARAKCLCLSVCVFTGRLCKVIFAQVLQERCTCKFHKMLRAVQCIVCTGTAYMLAHLYLLLHAFNFVIVYLTGDIFRRR